MNKKLFYSILIISLGFSQNSYSKNYFLNSFHNHNFENEEDLENLNTGKMKLLIVPFKGWNGIQEKFYSSMSDKLLESQLKKIKKFEIYKDKEFSEILDEVRIEENTENILSYARDKKIKYIIIPRFKQNSIDFNDISTAQENFVQGRKVIFELQVLDVMSGEIIYKTDSTLIQTRRIIGNNFYSQIEKLFDGRILSVVQKLDETFLIKAELKNEENRLIINRGSNEGITKGMLFIAKTKEKTKDNFNYTNTSYLRVSEVMNNRSVLTLLSGKKPLTTVEVIETKKSPEFLGFITKIDKNNILTLDIGENQGVKSGDIYKVVENINYKDSKTGISYKLNDKEKGIIIITDTTENSSNARIIRGISGIKENMSISEYNTSSYLEPFIRAAYYDYNLFNSGMQKDSLIRLSTGFEDMKNSYFFDFGFNLALIGGTRGPIKAIGGINNINASAGYNFPLLTEYIYAIPSMQLGFGSASLSNSTLSLDLTPKVAVKFTYNKFSLWVESGYSAKIGFRQLTSSESSGFMYGYGLSYLF